MNEILSLRHKHLTINQSINQSISFIYKEHQLKSSGSKYLLQMHQQYAGFIFHTIQLKKNLLGIFINTSQ